MRGFGRERRVLGGDVGAFAVAVEISERGGDKSSSCVEVGGWESNRQRVFRIGFGATTSEG